MPTTRKMQDQIKKPSLPPRKKPGISDSESSNTLPKSSAPPPRLPPKSYKAKPNTELKREEERKFLLIRLQEELDKIEEEMKNEALRAQKEYDEKVAAVRLAEKEAAEEQSMAQALAEKEVQLRKGNPFLRGLKKVGLGVAGIAAGLSFPHLL